MTSNSISRKYQKLEQREHVLARPGMYVGSIEEESVSTWVYDSDAQAVGKREIRYVPALYKVFDEILTNALDHAARLATDPDPKVRVKEIRVDINRETGLIEVFNSGAGIDVTLHPEHNVYVPELVFGNLLTSTNYDDDGGEERLVGGQNGLGAKCTNVFSKRFQVETVDATRKKVYTQTFFDNMCRKGDPIIRACAKKPYTRISFCPDYDRFGCEGISDDLHALLCKRVFDACALTPDEVSVFLDGTRLEFKTFAKYANLYLGLPQERARVHERINDRWEVIASATPGDGFEHVSFVNGVWTIKGGRHVDHLSQQISKRVCEVLQQRRKLDHLKPAHVRDHLILLVKAHIPNAAFDSQTKDTMITPVSKWGTRVEVSDAFIDKLCKSDLGDLLQAAADAAANKVLAKSDGRKHSSVRGIAKLHDAGWAGSGARAKDAVLCLVEGDSAAAMAIAGRSAAQSGTNKFGIFSLKGKPLNARDATAAKMADNAEICAVKKILGLENGRTYTDTSPLRYGSVMLLTDADSVPGDTPLLLRHHTDGVIKVCAIDNIAMGWTAGIRGGKEYAFTDYDVWTDQGWTPILHMMRHKTEKRLFRIVADTGVVEVTEDHSLLDALGREMTPKECAIGQALLHSFPDQASMDAWALHVRLPQDAKMVNAIEAFIMGVFWAQGHCGERGGWCIAHQDVELLEMVQTGLERCYHDYAFNIFIFTEDLHRLVIKGEGGQEFVDTYRDMFYTDGDLSAKRVPMEIFNAPCDIRRAFYEGAMACPDSAWDVSGKVNAMGFFYLVRSLGYAVIVRDDDDDSDLFHLSISHAAPVSSIIHRIVDLGVRHTYVYDLETQNHHFHAGVGQTIVHNTDGVHIQSLVLNLFGSQWPSLLRMPGFLTAMRTPIVKVSKGRETRAFYNLPEFHEWQKEDARGWTVKYFKGLATSNSVEAKEYFKNMKKVEYAFESAACEAALDLAFSKKRADDRKLWLEAFDPETVLDYSKKRISYEEFINRELIQFSIYDVERSIPSMVDGLKVSQRKILFAALKRNLVKEMRVAQLSGYVSEVALYHHVSPPP